MAIEAVTGLRRRFSIGLACSALAGCAGAARAPEAPAPPAADESTKAVAAPAPAAYPAAPASGAAAPAAPQQATAPPAAQPVPAEGSREAASSSAMGSAQAPRDLEEAEREIAAGDCATACRALGSMERSIALLCTASRPDGDGDRCADAKHRLVAARRKVAASCGSCPGGPSVDPDAPVPSRR